MPWKSNHAHSYLLYKQIESEQKLKKSQPLPQTTHYLNKNDEVSGSS